MFSIALLSIAGMLAGLLLLRNVRVLRMAPALHSKTLSVSVIIPARNEAANLPHLLQSFRGSTLGPHEIIVVDDHSTDATAAIAITHGATVIAAAPLPLGWTGKTWACHQGSLAATGAVLFFLDADTFFVGDGYQRTITFFAALTDNAAMSILPFHRMERWYEELSLLFNIIIAMGAGGFGRLDPPQLFGPSLLLHREMYERAGGYKSVRGEILENLHLARMIRAAGGVPHTFGGRGVLEMRMFPHGYSQLRESWVKAFAAGADTVSPLALMLSIVWLGGILLPVIALASHPGLASFALYLLSSAQIVWYARQLGTFRAPTLLLYFLPLLFYFDVFAQSLLLRLRKRPVSWRGRSL